MNEKKAGIVFFIGNMSHSGGTERVLSVIANGLSERGFCVTVVSLWGDGETFFHLGKDIKVFWMKKEYPKAGIIGQLQILYSILIKENTEVLVDVDTILGCYSFFMKCRMPYLYWISWEHFHYYFPFEKNRILRKAVKRVVGRYADWLIVLTDRDKDIYKKRMNLKCRIACIHDPAPYNTDYEKETDKPMILAAGRLTKVKGFDMLIDIWKQLEDRYPQWTMFIAGQGEEKENLERKAEEEKLKRLKFIGNVSDIEKYYKKAAFFVLPSREEGFGMALLESMCFGLPAVSFACRMGPREIVTDGENGFLIEPGDISAFARKMELLMKDSGLRRKMGEKARESAGRFEKEYILDKWEVLIDKR